MDQRDVVIDLAKYRFPRAAARQRRELKTSGDNVRRGDRYRHLIEYALHRFQAPLRNDTTENN
jgi:hypothetical protein